METHLLGNQMGNTIEEIIKRTVDETILRLQVAGLLKDAEKTAYQKTEELLRSYNALSMSGDETAERMILKIEAALQLIKDDPYYEIIPRFYISGESREALADSMQISVTTISRNKARLVEKLSAVLFASDFIRALFA